MKRSVIIVLLITGFILLVFSGCTPPTRMVVVYQEPPPPIYEVRGACRGVGWIWVRGHWTWRRDRCVYAWIPGKCVKKHPHKRWIPGCWERYGHGWIWIEGRWD
jgi:hypothetical protein